MTPLHVVGPLRWVLVLTTLALASLPAFAQDPVFRPRSSSPHDFVELDEGSVFLATTGAEEEFVALWRTDGTLPGTLRLALCPGSCRAQNRFVLRTPGGEQAFFTSWNFDSGVTDLWRTDGTIAGTMRLTRFTAGGAGVGLYAGSFVWTEIGQRLFFSVSEGSGSTLWVSDGTPAGTRPVYSFGARGAGPLSGLGDRTLIAVTTFVEQGADRTELWVSDGSTSGTLPLVEVGQAVHSSLTVGGRVVLLASDAPGRCGVALWSTDGTAAGTRPLESFDTPACGAPSTIHRAGDWGVFTVAPGMITNLWRTDGTAAGTGPVTAFTSPDAFAGPGGAPVWQPPYLYFVAGYGTPVGSELWRSQGSPETTELVVDLEPGPGTVQPALLGALGDGRVLFGAGDFFTGYRPWITDGTAAGTRRIAEAQIGWHAVLAGRVVFAGFTQAEGWELWGADLSGGEAARLTDLALISGVASEAESAGRVGNLALFAAADPLHGKELWRSDGTAAGTYRLANLAPDGDVPQAPPQVPANLAVVPLSDDVVQVRWDAVPGAERYFLSGGGVEGPLGHQDEPIFDTIGSFIVPPGSAISVQVRAENAHGSSAWSDEVSGTAFEPGLLAGECPESAEALCLQGGRFRVRVHWRNQHAPPQAVTHGTGRSVAPPDNETTGYFWFFTEDNVELIVKMLDGTIVNGFQWAFYGALSDVEYWITVVDTLATSSRTYHNPPGQICGRGDTSAFGNSRSSLFAASATSAPPLAAGSQSSARFSSASTGPCQADAETLCLLDGRYEVQVDWRDQHNDQQGVGRSVPFRDLSGFFWFFHPDNIELVVKILDGTPVNGKVWVFYGALSDVGYTLRVRETATGDVAEYVNPPGNICGAADTAAF